MLYILLLIYVPISIKDGEEWQVKTRALKLNQFLGPESIITSHESKKKLLKFLSLAEIKLFYSYHDD